MDRNMIKTLVTTIEDIVNDTDDYKSWKEKRDQIIEVAREDVGVASALAEFIAWFEDEDCEI